MVEAKFDPLVNEITELTTVTDGVLALVDGFVSQVAAALADRICLTSAKNVTILGLPRVTRVLHLVCAHRQSRYYLLSTGIHRFLAPLFTSMPNLFGTSTLPHRHDSTQTRNSACVTE